MARFKTRGTLAGALPHTGERAASWVVGALGVAALVAMLVPLLAISAYNHSYADDWHYGVWAHLTLEETGNVLLAIVTAFEQVGKAWMEWQGTYSAIFLMAIQPGVFGEQCYVVAAPIVMGLLVAGTLFFCHVALVELLGAERGLALGVGCAVVAVQLLLQPSPVEGIFWYNSAIYYTGYHAAMLALMACLMRVCDPARARRPTAAAVWAVVLAAFVAGGNFVTALVTAELMLALMICLIASGRRCAVDVLPAFAVMVLGLALSLAAPGNEVRQQTQFPEDSAGVWGTIWQSSLAAFQYLGEWSGGLVFVLVAFFVPVAMHAASRAVARGWRFRWPLAVVVGSIALFATSFTPTFWGEGSVGPGRVQNCRFDLFVALLLVDVQWVVGWLAARRAAEKACAAPALNVESPFTGEGPFAKAFDPDAPTFADEAPRTQVSPCNISSNPRVAAFGLRHVAAACALAMLVAVCLVGSMAADEDLGEDLSSVSAARSLASGQAAAYDQQVWERIATIEGSGSESLTVPYYTDVPHVLLMGDIRDNMDNYINYRLAQWYGKESIIGYRAATAASAAKATTESGS